MGIIACSFTSACARSSAATASASSLWSRSTSTFSLREAASAAPCAAFASAKSLAACSATAIICRTSSCTTCSAAFRLCRIPLRQLCRRHLHPPNLRLRK